MIEGYKIDCITINKPYGSKPGDGKPLDGTIHLEGYGNKIEMKIDQSLLEPIVGIIAGAIAEAGKRAAEAMIQLAQDHGATVIEAAPQPEAIGHHPV